MIDAFVFMNTRFCWRDAAKRALPACYCAAETGLLCWATSTGFTVLGGMLGDTRASGFSLPILPWSLSWGCAMDALGAYPASVLVVCTNSARERCFCDDINDAVIHSCLGMGVRCW